MNYHVVGNFSIMSKQYITITGDTFETIARKQYGDEQEANKIAKANPGVVEPLSAQTIIIIPNLSTIPLDKQQNNNATNIDEVSLLIDNRRFRFWTDIRITRAIDNMDTVEFSAPFDSKAGSETIDSFRKIFKPFSYRSIVVNVGGNVLFTGVMIGINPPLEPNSKTVSLSCYSLPGVLNDCTASAASYPLEFIELNLRDIAKALIEPFGLDLEFKVDPGAVFDLVAIKENETVLSFLITLAKQRNLIISSTSRGKLLFQQSTKKGKPVTKLFQGKSPLISVTPLFNPQEYYSHITGIESIAIGSFGSQFTVKNPRLTGVLRPLNFTISDTLDADIKTVVQAKMGRMFGNMVSYSVSVATWRDSKDDLWTPNTTVILHAHDAMIYKNYEFVIRNVDFKRDAESESAILNLVIPGSFEGKIPSTLPWDG